MLKIATILPYKENYTLRRAAAASLWVCDFYKYSKYKSSNFIFGNTNSKDYLTKNYVNIDVKNAHSRFSSTTIKYSKNLIDKIQKYNFDIIEIHNRPLMYNYIKNHIKAKYILYFHNDPISMNGSKTANERLNLITSIDKIIFVSEWVRNRFFINIENKFLNKTEIVYPSIDVPQKITNKKKKIVFVGKLNESKGYDLYKDAINKILNEFNDWKAYSIGDESRRKHYITHKNHFELGLLKHKKVLNFLNNSEIAVVPSRWEEPFGRTALEASSRACATIISNRGGLPETTNAGFILKKLNSYELYKSIKFLILNNKFRKKLQINGLNNIKHITKDNSKKIDQIRSSLVYKFNLNYVNNNLRILNIYNLGQKINHRLYNISIGKKFTNGFIRNGHDVLEISDRDFMRHNRQLGFSNVHNKFQKYLKETYSHYQPNLVFFGHTNNISLDTFDDFRKINKNLIISQWNEDPLMPDLSDSSINIKKIMYYNKLVDHNFITTYPGILKKNYHNVDNFHYFLIPVDKNIECFDVYNLEPQNDIFYAMSHGVNRGSLKEGKSDKRSFFLDALIKKMSKNIKYAFYGYENQQPVWGADFYDALLNSKMGLNLSRGKPTKYYSSNRIASLIGNGLLTFIDKKTMFDNIFNQKEVIYYNNISDLSEKILKYKKDNILRKKIAKNGKKKYFNLFNEKKITKHLIDISLGKQSKLF